MSPSEWAVLAGAGASIALVNWYFFIAGRNVESAVAAPAGADSSATTAGPSTTRTVAEVVIVVDGGYAPSTVRVRTGERLRLVFDRKDDASCSEEVVIPEFGIRKFLPASERTTIEVIPTKSGRVPFTCGMGMLRGTIVVED